LSRLSLRQNQISVVEEAALRFDSSVNLLLVNLDNNLLKSSSFTNRSIIIEGIRSLILQLNYNQFDSLEESILKHFSEKNIMDLMEMSLLAIVI